MSKSAIEWTEQTWNPIVGCSIVSPGCTNCYAMQMAARIQKMNLTGGSNSNYVNHYDGTTKSVNGKIVWTGQIAMAPDKLFLQPLSRKRPTTYFVNSMGDLFHEDCPDEWIDRVFAVMALAPQHTFQVLTKRAARMRDYCARHAGVWCPAHRQKPLASEELILDGGHGRRGPLPNVWLGVSTERQQEADERIPLLLKTPAAVRFISAEPLLGHINIQLWMQTVPSVDWVIVGGESGPGARPMHPAWARSLRDQCDAAGVAFFFKQWGEWHPRTDGDGQTGIAEHCLAFNGAMSRGDVLAGGADRPRWVAMNKIGKKRAGRKLYGIEYNAMPEPRA